MRIKLSNDRTGYGAVKPARRKVTYPDISWSYLDGFDDEEMLRVPEENIQACLIAYISERYPAAIYNSNVASNVELGWKKAVRQKAQGNMKSWPDFFLANKRGGYSGLFLEIKKHGTKIETAEGRPATDHISRQLNMLLKLREQGYCSFMAVGWKQARGILDWYMSLPDESTTIFGICLQELYKFNANVQK